MTFTRNLLRMGLLVLAVLTCTGAIAGPHFSRVVVFGDSLSDPGNTFVIFGEVSVRPYDLVPSAPYGRGGLHFTNGETWVEQLAKRSKLNRSVGPALRVPGVFSNYAFGGARARMTSSGFDLPNQATLFLSDFGNQAPSDALYVFFVGGNDVQDALVALVDDPTGATSMEDIITEAVTAISDNFMALAEAGAKTFLVLNGPNLAAAPAVRLQGPSVQTAAQSLSIAFNNALEAVLTSLETSLPMITIRRFDFFSLINEIVADPEAAGFLEVEAPCITPGVIVGAVCDRPDEFLFWDGIHPTLAGHALLARRVGEAFTPP